MADSELVQIMVFFADLPSEMCKGSTENSVSIITFHILGWKKLFII